MRDKPFAVNTPIPEEVTTTTVTPQSDDYRVDLFERLGTERRTHQEKSAPAPASPDVSTTTDEKVEPDPIFKEASATFEGDPDDEFADMASEKFEKILTENPEELAELFIELGNVGRIIWGPGLYEGLMYPGQERNDVRYVIAKSIENEKNNKPPTEGFNNYELRLYNKWPKLQESIQNISFTDEQIKRLAKLFGKRIEEVGVPEFIDKNRWFLYWIGLELAKSKNIIQSRTTDAFAKKWGFG